MKRIISILLVAIMLIPLAAFSSAKVDDFSVKVDKAALISLLETEALKLDFIDVSAFKIPYTPTNELAFEQMCIDEAPLLFHMDDVMILPDEKNEYISQVYFTSIYEDDVTYKEKYDACVAKGEKLLSGIKGNSALDDVTKALLLHDRLAEICRYDREGVETKNVAIDGDEICGPFIDGKAICTGYCSAYMYLLREVGIKSRLVRSIEMNHAWLIVTLDGKEYHADVTFDDAVPDVLGRISHLYFMVSTEKLKTLGKYDEIHHGFYNDWDSTPDSTLYDNAYWRTSEAVWQVVGNSVYYIDHTAKNEALWRVGDKTPLLKLDEMWMESSASCWDTNHYCLSSDGTDLLYSGPKDIFVYDLSEGRARKAYTPEIENEFDNIFGFGYEDGYLVYSVHSESDFNEGDTLNVYSDEEFRIKVPYGDAEDPDPTPDPDPSYENKFTDVKEEHWFAKAVEYVVTKGYMSGMSETKFGPNRDLTREQFVLILANIAKVETDNYKNTPSGFADVPTGKWYSGAVTWGVSEGYISGMSKTKFGTGQSIQRGALARLLYVYAASNGADVTGRADLSAFVDSATLDIQGNAWMKEPIQWAVDAGIISGMNVNGGLGVNPKGTASRAQTAVMLKNYDEFSEKGE